jgi:rubrerythrin
MGSIKGTRTEKNLLAAFAGESQASNRYNYWAKQAKKDGYVQVSMAFEETAQNEQQHAKQFFKYLEGGMVEIQASYPAGVIGTTAENLKAAAEGENEEWSQLYPEFAKVADEEGFPEVAATFKAIAVAEKQHEKRYLGLLKNVEDGTAFKKGQKVRWKCNNCGYIHEGDEAPELCPACKHPQAYFEVVCENW